MNWKNEGAGPIQCKRFNDAWGKLRTENNTFVELYGVVGESERSSTLINLFGVNVRPDVLEAQKRIGERYAWTITRENVAEIIKAIDDELPALQKTRPVVDKRETPAQVAERAAESKRLQDEHTEQERAKGELFAKLYGTGEVVAVPDGSMVVTATLCCDKSDLMTDYFDRHHSLSPCFALLVVPKQAQTERLARQAVSVSPILADCEFSWHTETYSMGHGNYLSGKGFELPSEIQERSKVTHGHWEIEFSKKYPGHDMSLPTFQGFGTNPKPEPQTASVSGVTISENTDKQGIELRFPEKPAAEVLSNLKANGWRWSRFSQCWYKRASQEAREFAQSLAS